MTETPANQQAVTEIAKESPDAAGLIYQIVTASMDANARAFDNLYEHERSRRQALEVRIERFLAMAVVVAGGTTRQYEDLIDMLRYPELSVDEYAAMHRENDDH